MINTNNTVDLNLSRSDVAETLGDQLVSSIIKPSKRAPITHKNNSIFLSIRSNKTSQRINNSTFIISEKCRSNTKDKKSFEIVVNPKERVKVQHLQTHSKLQNNRWNHHTFCIPTVDRKIDMPNINNNTNRINHNVSAFEQCKVSDKKSVEVSVESGYSNIEHMTNRILDKVSCENFREIDNDKHTLAVCRTEDQENAFRRIEDVHNYSKLNRHGHSNDSSNSSFQEEDGKVVDGEDGDIEDEIPGGRFETYRFLDGEQQSSGNSDGHFTVNRDASEEPHKPDHHARRPMNAFLIFCKRHRSIVKDRYRSFENRTITKILGDWWASLELNEKKCYTSLAQQNKDAFFNANPNFKWYKLPAPPLRTLHTRPSNTERFTDQILDAVPTNDHMGGEHIFKLADETQMGDLSALMCDKKISNQNALQRALGETTEYLSIQIPEAKPESLHCKWTTCEAGYKRKLEKINTLHCTSSEENPVPKKSTRLCKGKIYQELINSGQIAAITKKKVPKVSNNQRIGKHFSSVNNDLRSTVGLPCSSASPSCEHNCEEHYEYKEAPTKCEENSEAPKCNYSPHEISNHFDLDEKIKGLPALSLDVYLQRKRSTKKKKKNTSRKRNPSSIRKNIPATLATSVITGEQVTPLTKESSVPHLAYPMAVGSQKRKAKKESITRRDISITENEAPALLRSQEDYSAITCNGSYFYNVKSFSATPTALSSESLSNKGLDSSAPSLMSESPAVEFSNSFTKVNNNISSTSDLFILAEVAAKRTENSN